MRYPQVLLTCLLPLLSLSAAGSAARAAFGVTDSMSSGESDRRDLPAAAWQAEAAAGPCVTTKIVLHGTEIDPERGSITADSVPLLDAAVEILSAADGPIMIAALPPDRVISAAGRPHVPRSPAEVVRRYLSAHGIRKERMVIQGPNEAQRRSCTPRVELRVE